MSQKLRMAAIAGLFLLIATILWSLLPDPALPYESATNSRTIPISYEIEEAPDASPQPPSQNNPSFTDPISQDTVNSKIETVTIPNSDQPPKKIAFNVVSISGKVVSQLDQSPVKKFELLLAQGQYSPEMDKNYREFITLDGEFKINEISANRPLSLHVRTPGYADAFVDTDDLNDPANRSNKTITLQPDYVFTGQVVDPRGNPVEGVRILKEQLQPKHQNLEFGTVATTDTLGAFTIGGLENKPYALNTHHENYFPTEYLVNPSLQSVPIRMSIDGLGSVEGYVTLSGLPLHDVMVQCDIFDNEQTSSRARSINPNVMTDIDGYFLFPDVSEGAGYLEVRTRTDLHGRSTTGETVLRTKMVDIVVTAEMTTRTDIKFQPATASIEGYVIADDAESLSRRVNLKVFSSGVQSNRYTQSDHTGYFQFTEVPPGTVSLTTRLPTKSAFKFVNAELYEDSLARVDVDLRTGSTIRCRIGNVNPNSQASACIIPGSIRLPDYPIRDTTRFLTNRSSLRTIIANGKCEFNNVDAGTYTIALIALVWDDGKVDYSETKVVTTTFTVEEGVDLNLDLSY